MLYSTDAYPGSVFIYWYCYDHSGQCDPGTFAYTWNGGWLWWTNHYTVFCSIFQSLFTLEDTIRNAQGDTDKPQIMEEFQTSKGQVMLHETYHYKGCKTRSIPYDITKLLNEWVLMAYTLTTRSTTAVVDPMTDDYCYRATGCWDLAKDKNTEYTLYTADSFALDAIAIYVQQTLSRAEPPIPCREYRKSSPDPGKECEEYYGPAGSDADASPYKLFADVPPGWSGAPIVDLNPDPDYWTEIVAEGVEPLGPDLNLAKLVFGDQPVPTDLSTLKATTSIADVPATPTPEHDPPNCSTDGISFPQSLAASTIADLCGDHRMWAKDIVAPINIGSGLKNNGREKVLAAYSSVDIPDTTNKLYVGIVFDDGNTCLGTMPFTIGATDEEKKHHCQVRLETVLNGCQTDTVDAKLGGRIKDSCLTYAITAVKDGEDEPFSESVWWKGLGDFTCQDTDPSLGDELAKTCTCWYSGYDMVRTLFNRPDSGNCQDTNKADLKNP